MSEIFNFKMDHEFFADMQKNFPGFGNENFFMLSQEEYDNIFRKVLPYFNKTKNNAEAFTDEVLVKRFENNDITLDDIKLVIISFIFGAYGCSVDLDFAEKMIRALFKVTQTNKPEKSNILDKEYTYWLSEMGVSYILLGTVYSYKKEYIKAAYFFMLGLKTDAINLNMPYCDFINYILGKLKGLSIENDIYFGCGFDAENPMGSVSGKVLIADKSVAVITEMEGLKGEVVVAYAGRTRTYGYLQRIGSTRNQNGQMIDIYETYVIDSDYKLYKVKFFFNGYFSGGLTEAIRIAKGFRLKANSLKNLYYKVLD